MAQIKYDIREYRNKYGNYMIVAQKSESKELGPIFISDSRLGAKLSFDRWSSGELSKQEEIFIYNEI